MGCRSKLPVKDREAAVLELLGKEDPARVISRRYGVSEQTLYRWRDRFLEGGRSGLSKQESTAVDRRIKELERELDRRAQAIGELSLANGLLRKLQVYPR